MLWHIRNFIACLRSYLTGEPIPYRGETIVRGEEPLSETDRDWVKDYLEKKYGPN